MQLAHLNQQLEAWLIEEADQRVHGTVREVVARRFTQEAPALRALPPGRFVTDYHDTRRVAWDGYVAVRGNRYSVPGALAGQLVAVRLSLDGELKVYAEDRCVTRQRLRDPAEGGVSVAEHHQGLWRRLRVEQRDLASYEEVA